MPNLTITPTQFQAGTFNSDYRYLYKNAAPLVWLPYGQTLDIQSTGEFRIVYQGGSASTAGYTGSFATNSFFGVSK